MSRPEGSAVPESSSDAVPAGATPRPTRRRPAPVVRWIRSLSRAAYAGAVIAVMATLLLLAILVNPGERVGPVQPARPPVGGPGLPATRL